MDHINTQLSQCKIFSNKIQLLDEEFEFLNVVINKALPRNYNFEISKCILKIRQLKASKIALQMPEGLLNWSCEISDILRFFCPSVSEVIIMADVTYGACCIDDITTMYMGCDLLIHFGHSCLIPVTSVEIECLYVFVEISFPTDDLVRGIEYNFDKNDHLYLMGTIQYSNVLREAVSVLNNKCIFKNIIEVPRVAPLMHGEVLGCTSPILDIKMEDDSEHKIIFVADGRFHLESVLIQNPNIPLYRFDPFTRIFSEESYDLDCLHKVRMNAIITAREAKSVCLILSTLGRQGNTNILTNLCNILNEKNVKHYNVLLSEITLEKLSALDSDAFVQVGCPRLSIDWGITFNKPLLNPYEAYVAFNNVKFKSIYPMDYYSKNGGDWSNYTTNFKCKTDVDTRELIRRRLLQKSAIQYTK